MATVDDEQDITCRVCRCGPDDVDEELFTPCKCAGSIASVHQGCLESWLRHSGKTECELCRVEFRFRPVYAPNAPPVPTLSDWFIGLSTLVRKHAPTACRVATALTCWLVFLPLMLSVDYALLVHFPSFSTTYTQERWSHRGMLLCDWLFGLALLMFLVLCVFTLSPVLEFAYTEALEQLRLEALFAHQDPVPAAVDVMNPLQAAGQVGVQGQVPIPVEPAPEAHHHHNNGDLPILHRQDAVDVQSDSDDNDEGENGIDDGVDGPPEAAADEAAAAHNLIDGNQNWGVDVAVPQVDAAPVPPQQPAFPAPDAAFDDPPPITLMELLGFTGTFGGLIISVVWGFLLASILLAILVGVPMLTPSSIHFCARLVAVVVEGGDWPKFRDIFLTSPTPVTPLMPTPHVKQLFSGYAALLTVLTGVWFVSFCVMRLNKLPGLQFIHERVGKASLLVTFQTTRLLVLMAYRCVLQPVVIGFILDCGLLPLLGGTVASRLQFLMFYPLSFAIVHWLLGLSFVLYSASILLQVREVMHPLLVASWVKPFDPNRGVLRWTLEQSLPDIIVRSVIVLSWSTTACVFICFLPGCIVSAYLGRWQGIAAMLGDFSPVASLPAAPDATAWIFPINLFYPYLSVQLCIDAIVYNFALSMAVDAAKVMAWMAQTTVLPWMCGVLGLRHVLLRPDFDTLRFEDVQAGMHGEGHHHHHHHDDDDEDDDDDDTDSDEDDDAGRDNEVPVSPHRVAAEGNDADDIDPDELAMEMQLRVVRQQWEDMYQPRRPPQRLPQVSTAEALADWLTRLPTSKLALLWLGARLAVFVVIMWTYIVSYVYAMLLSVLWSGRWVLEALYPWPFFAKPSRFLLHDPTLSLCGAYAIMHICHVITICAVALLTSFGSAMASLRWRHVTSIQSPMVRKLASVAVRMMVPVWRFAAKSCRFEKMRPLRLGPDHNRPVLSHFRSLFLSMFSVMIGLPAGIGWLAVCIAQPMATTHVLWTRSNFPGTFVMLAKTWLLGSLILAILYDLGSIGCFGRTVRRSLLHCDIKLMQGDTHHILSITVPVARVVAFTVVLLKAVNLVILPDSYGVPIPAPGNATATEFTPLAPMVLGSLSLPLPRPFGSLVMMTQQAMQPLTTKLVCVNLHPLFCEARWDLSLFVIRWLGLATLVLGIMYVMWRSYKLGNERQEEVGMVRTVCRLMFGKLRRMQQSIMDARYRVGSVLLNHVPSPQRHRHHGRTD